MECRACFKSDGQVLLICTQRRSPWQMPSNDEPRELFVYGRRAAAVAVPLRTLNGEKSHKCPFCVALFAGQRQIFILNQISGDEEKLHTNKFPSSTWCMCVFMMMRRRATRLSTAQTVQQNYYWFLGFNQL